MTLHVIGYPHTETNKNYGQCAYTQKAYKFLQMYPDAIHYGNEGSIGNLVQIFGKNEVQKHFGHLGEMYYAAEWSGPAWDEYNRRVIEALRTRLQPHDLILILGGIAQKVIADAYPNNMTVEYGIGYDGVFSPYRVFESYTWQSYVHGKYGMGDGRFYDAVIPNYVNVDDFEYRDQKDDYLVFLSRMTKRKGYEIAIAIAEATKTKLIIAGAGGDRPQSEFVEYVGYADTKKRAELLAGAKALLCPTIYLEPFGGVAIEAMISGTPAISTDFGAFSETIQHGVTGYRCHTLEQFVWATQNVGKLDPAKIRDYAVANYDIKHVKSMYDEYFAMLEDLWAGGWYEMGKNRVQLDWLNKKI